MKITRRREWLLLAAFSVFGVLVFGLLHFFAVRFIRPAEDVRDYYAGVIGFEDTAGPLAPEMPRGPRGSLGSTRMLIRDEEVLIGETVLIYRGLISGDTFAVDVIIPAFDPQSPFHHRYGISDAEKGFTLGPLSFRLLNATPTVLHLEKIDG